MENIYDNHPIDLSYLIEMLGNNRTFIIEFFDTFSTQTPLYLEELDLALTNQDWERVADCAHKIKPTFGYFGRNDIRDLVHDIERSARQKMAPAQIITDVQKLKSTLNQLYLQIAEARINL
ncbi:Hpt domain-containing protein [Pedobacter rhizosphaerae]|uniref:HPt (Histidine-containing phosphotransfer) domain-containing protein n=1 Tax=Pedobacter rhizosphaerae TaxID=390241 RepID=A0A1H9STA7_9SPHI|nr:Hpt domain-containing protein [Pedobacter rhizosphaerae]SER87633.1 HPt (histidine-containing phosphotransfer) domain-containing protein [Pedobacter rhizosphaerae]